MIKILHSTVGNILHYLKHKEKHNVQVYNDGPKILDSVGFAAVLPSPSHSGRLPRTASIFTTKMPAMKTVIKELIENNRAERLCHLL